MFDAPKSLPSDPGELRVAAESLVELAKAQALEIEKLKHQLAFAIVARTNGATRLIIIGTALGPNQSQQIN